MAIVGSDNNGTANCSGDLAIDYDLRFPYLQLDKEKTIYLKQVDSIVCEE